MYFMEKTFIVGGKLGLAAELAIELANASGRFRGPIRFKLHGEGDQRACTASAILMDGETVENTVTYAMAKADGWAKNTKWQSLRDQMLQYRAGVFLARLYAGGSMGGMHTREELEDVVAARRLPAKALAGPVDPEPAAVIAPPKSPPKPPLLVRAPDGSTAEFDRTRRGLEQAYEFMSAGVLDGVPEVVSLNNDLLDTIAEKMPEYAEKVADLRAAAAMVQMQDAEPEPDDAERDEFGLPPVRPADPEVLPTDPP
jgi:hypothetical protein